MSTRDNNFLEHSERHCHAHCCGVLVTFQRINRQAPRVSPAISDRISREHPSPPARDRKRCPDIERGIYIYIYIDPALVFHLILFRFCSTLIRSRWGGLVSDPVSRALNRVYNGDARPLSGIEIRFGSKRAIFYDSSELLRNSYDFYWRKKKKKVQFESLRGRSMISVGGKRGERNDFLISYSPSKLQISKVSLFSFQTSFR